MKKKNIAIGKKLSFNKETIASLNAGQQQLIAGGATTVTRVINCTTGLEETCPTIPFTGRVCVRCM
ncbi:class I lanthipeptide [Chitinophaga oryzae]|uniref:Class I lanthipeptide n=1 Tax=Chitinophaga oryzae TaxID=2725414 RepID=A0AAE6ZHE6_9BACT|nr:class I lanthipeptide [Chitinophaga oryzae]QJB31824.1 class I lanthipeptide [Chitinophaga oryzae]QJB38302.1 class I lanthipeptide [Chitinophaga oryzae]